MRFAVLNAELGESGLPLPSIVTRLRLDKFQNGTFDSLGDYLDDALKSALRDAGCGDELDRYEVRITNRTRNGYFKISQDGELIAEIGIYKKAAR